MEQIYQQQTQLKKIIHNILWGGGTIHYGISEMQEQMQSNKKK